ncbi:MAG: 1-(5-phosphoribosyl)-5-((5-phosphoribosylamino)methylideneamino)imidazole-4-carboxamide isomerase, partial [Candidatus Competibacter sp.]
VKALCAVEKEGITGAIIGRALYDGAIDLAAAQQIAAGESA